MNDAINTKAAFVTVIGPSNAGKSTLINKIVGNKVSIVTHKVQTTRGILRAVFTEKNTQIVLLDTPGIFVPKFSLEKQLVKSAWRSIRGTDIVVIMIDAANGITPNVKTILSRIGKNAIIVINKVDLINRSDHLMMISNISNLCKNFKEIFSISALKNKGVTELKNYIVKEAPISPWHFENIDFTDAPLDFTLSEITREKLFLRVHQEVPYALTVMTELTKEEDGVFIVHQVIYVASEAHKKIIIGSGANVIKYVRKKAMHEMSRNLKKNVNLFIFVKINPKWYEDSFIMNTISYI